ncbi:YihY/virulence factor BrkB family protein [Corynebacterium breve]|uniref:YihY/virulence factor BrkB family protein n=1 Tax=Corynebacterium breve TaxID=3049799 RepID=A0ABY8VJT5_9CORY|nr:YihY/virulence factor BrkB family protein [Corynebacterium breve]WIM68464.1 YihY/virulence factor BrkB family protein [Corynebacterium breve]
MNSEESAFIVQVGGSTAEEVAGGSLEQNPLARGNRLSSASWALVARRTWNDFFLNAMMDRGAVQTFFMLLTFAPTVLAAYSIATLALAKNEAQVTELTDELISEYIPDGIADTVRGVVDVIVGSSSEGTIALVVGVLVALFSSSAWVRSFARSANYVYGRVEGRTVVPTWLVMWGLTIVMVLGAVMMLGAFLLRQSIVAVFLQPIAEPLGITGTVNFLLGIFLPVWAWLRYPVIAVLAIVMIALLYHYAPNVRPSRFRWLSFGSVFSICSIGIVWWLFSLYLSTFASTNAYGAVGTIIAVLMALWIMNVILVLGVKLDAEILRAKELQLGYDSEHTIQAPPRSSKAALHYANTQQRLEQAAQDIKLNAKKG